MNNLPQIFNYGEKQIRVVSKDGNPWWILKDVCAVLEIGNSRDVMARLDSDEKGVDIIDTPGGKQEASIINESGLYSVILVSRKSEAKKFKRWVTHEVLPSIRKHGAYMTLEKIEEVLLNPDVIIDLATRLKQEQEKRLEVEKQLEQDKPYTNFAKSIAHSSDCITIGEFAKVCNNNSINIGRNRLFSWLRNNRYLIKEGREHNVPKQQYVEQGLFQVKESVIHTIDNDLIRTTTLITGKGQMYFLDKLKTEFGGNETNRLEA